MIKIERNPKNQKLIEKLIIEKIITFDEIWYRVTINGKFVSNVVVIKGNNYISDIYIDKKYRRKGIGTFLYNYVEKDLNIKLKPSGGPKKFRDHSLEGKRFWKNRLKHDKTNKP